MKPTIRKPTEEEKTQASTWPIWEKEVSQFPWEYDTKETCLIIDGKIKVTNEDGEQFHISPGDYVVFPQGMKCTWNISENVRKYYRFG